MLLGRRWACEKNGAKEKIWAMEKLNPKGWIMAREEVGLMTFPRRGDGVEEKVGLGMIPQGRDGVGENMGLKGGGRVT
jgi:hypothetical protein